MGVGIFYSPLRPYLCVWGCWNSLVRALSSHGIPALLPAVFWSLYQLNFPFLGGRECWKYSFCDNGKCIFQPRDSLIEKLICPNPSWVRAKTCIWWERSSDSGRGVVLGLESQILRLGLLVPSGFLPCCRLKLSQASVTCAPVWGSLTWQAGLSEEADSCQDQWSGTRLLPALCSEHPCLSSVTQQQAAA